MPSVCVGPAHLIPSSYSHALHCSWRSGDAAYRKGKCDLGMGRWVADSGLPWYTGGSCKAIDSALNCARLGRTDFSYQKWRWQVRTVPAPYRTVRCSPQRERHTSVGAAHHCMGRVPAGD